MSPAGQRARRRATWLSGFWSAAIPKRSAQSADRRYAWFESYITTILTRDVRDLANIEKIAEIPRLLALLASRLAELANFANLSRGLAISVSTLKRYFALLEATFLVRLLPAWFGKHRQTSYEVTQAADFRHGVGRFPVGPESPAAAG